MKKRNLKVILLFCLIICVLFTYYSINSHAENANTKYKIQVNFDDQSKTLSCVETVTYTNNYKTSLNDLVLHLYPNSYSKSSDLPTIGANDTTKKLAEEEIGSISIIKASIENKGVTYSQDKQVLKFKLDTPLKSGNQIVLLISFTVKIPLGTDRLGYFNDVFSITNWYPIMSIYDPLNNTWDENEYNPIGESNYSDVSDYSIVLNTPKNIVTASTGVVQKELISGDTKTLEISAYNIRDFVLMMSKYYKVISTTADGVSINSFYIENKSSEDSSSAKKILEIVSDSEKFFSKTFGKYPYPKLDVVETYLDGGAMEYPALIQMGKYQGWTTESIEDHSSWLEDAAAHETGHQWWYVAVGNNEFKEPLMDESINTFSTAYYFEKRYGKYNKNSLTMKFRNNLVEGKTQPINSSVDKFNSWNDYTTVIYQRGPEIFEDLRNRVGDEKFVNIMKSYFAKFEFKNGSISDFLDVVGEIGGANIEAMIKDSINSDTYYPSNLKTTAGEKIQIDNVQLVDDLKKRESVSGLTLGSILLRGLKGEAINMILPSKLSVSENKNITTYANTVKANFNKYFNIKINIIKDNVVNSTQLTQNIIVLGNPDDNKIIKSLNNNLPIDLSKPSFLLDNDKIITNKSTGIYLIKNPKNKAKLLTVIFWKNSIPKYDFTLDNFDQYIINYGDNDEVRGRF